MDWFSWGRGNKSSRGPEDGGPIVPGSTLPSVASGETIGRRYVVDLVSRYLHTLSTLRHTAAAALLKDKRVQNPQSSAFLLKKDSHTTHMPLPESFPGHPLVGTSDAAWDAGHCRGHLLLALFPRVPCSQEPRALPCLLLLRSPFPSPLTFPGIGLCVAVHGCGVQMLRGLYSQFLMNLRSFDKATHEMLDTVGEDRNNACAESEDPTFFAAVLKDCHHLAECRLEMVSVYVRALLALQFLWSGQQNADEIVGWHVPICQLRKVGQLGGAAGAVPEHNRDSCKADRARAEPKVLRPPAHANHEGLCLVLMPLSPIFSWGNAAG